MYRVINCQHAGYQEWLNALPHYIRPRTNNAGDCVITKEDVPLEMVVLSLTHQEALDLMATEAWGGSNE